MVLLDTKLGRLWRILGTGFVFVVFGLGAIVVSLTIFPWARLRARDRVDARRRIQHGMQRTFAVFIWLMKSLGLLSYEVHGVERLRRTGYLVIANHPTLIDVVFLVSLMPQVDCIVKRGLWQNPFLRWPVSWAAYIPNSEGESLIQACAATLKRGNSLLVFPEGTRTAPGCPLRMQRGAAHIALAAGVDILPITIRCTAPFLTKGYPWYRSPPRRPHVRIEVGESIPARVYNPGGQTGSLAARRVTDFFADYYAELTGAGPAQAEQRPERAPQAETSSANAASALR